MFRASLNTGDHMAKKSKLVYKPEQLKTFWYWMNERHHIYLRRRERKPQPWTKDPILQTYKFTNMFRQLDRVTQEWLTRYCALLGTPKRVREDVKVGDKITDEFILNVKDGPNDGDILFHCAMFRLFNWPATYDALHYAGRWSYGRALDVLEKRTADKEQIFTGAYIIPNMGLDDPKIEIISAAVDLIHENRKAMAAYIRATRSMEKTCEVLQLVPTVGPFISYEIACDLRFTRLLADATDINTWANPGPGAMRGIHRLLTGSAKPTSPRPDYVAVMRDLLVRSEKALGPHVRACEWPVEMREIEHSLCEFDKYMRVKNGEGRPRSRFKPLPTPPWEEEKPVEKANVRVRLSSEDHEKSVKKFLRAAKRRAKKEEAEA